jgi:hypothetical protein
MAATDIQAEVSMWVADEVRQQCFTEDFGWSVTWAPAPVQTPAGVVIVPGWHLVLTTKSPLLGEGDLFHLAQLGAPRPAESFVRAEVGKGMTALRGLAKSKLNGHARVALPRGG